MKKLQQGFTLIELVIVITIIAILAAIALPKYVALQADARAAKIQAYAGTIKAAAALAKAQCVTSNSTGNVTYASATCNTVAGGTVTMDGTVVNVNAAYPAATAAGIGAAGQLAATDGLTITYAGNVATYQATGAAVPANCQVVYTWAPALNASPTVVATTTACN